MNQFEKEYYESEAFWEGEMLLDSKNRNRIDRTVQLIPSEVRSLIDVGCGNGVFLNYLMTNKPGLKLMGVDRSATALSHVQTNKQEEEINRLSFEDDSFDCVTCLEVIEHLPIPVYETALSELARISKRYIIVSVPYAERLEDAFTQCPNCKSIFNSDLHLRSFDDIKFKSLFDKFGYKCIASEKLGESQVPVGYRIYRKLLYRKQELKWNSPICPICGFAEQKAPSRESAIAPQRGSLISNFKALPKMIWPRETHYYWILGLFEQK